MPDAQVFARPRDAGLTLVESLMVAAVAGGLLATGLPALQQWRAQQAVRAAAMAFETDVHQARSLAVAQRTSVRLSVHATPDGGSCYLLHGGPREACSCGTRGNALCNAGQPLWQAVHFDAGAPVRLDTRVTGMVFDPTAGTVTPTGSVTFATPDGRAVRAVVSILGRVRQCSPGQRMTGLPPC